MPTSETRYLCRFTMTEVSSAVLIAEQPELPKIGETVEVPLRTGRYGIERQVVFIVDDFECSSDSELFVMVEVHLGKPIGFAGQ